MAPSWHFPSPSDPNLSPLTLSEALSARDAAAPTSIPGHGSISATSINNNAIFALFGLLGAGFVLSSIWFFFWAKNGGFRWRKRDWEDYKTTVLRRRGPNGTTLSGATRSTKLGGGSVVSSIESSENSVDLEKGYRDEGLRGGGAPEPKKKRGQQVKNSQDMDVRAYRHEKVAKVGGINREADGLHHDSTNSDFSQARAQNQPRSGPRGSTRAPRREFSYTPGTESVISDASNDSRRPLRPKNRPDSEELRTQRPIRHVPRSTNQRFSSRVSNSGSNGGSYTEPLDFSARREPSVSGSSEQARNTKSYHHPIAGLGRYANASVGSARRDYMDD